MPSVLLLGVSYTLDGKSVKQIYRKPFDCLAEIKENIADIDAKKPLNSEFEIEKAAIVCDDSNRKSCRYILIRGELDEFYNFLAFSAIPLNYDNIARL